MRRNFRGFKVVLTLLVCLVLGSLIYPSVAHADENGWLGWFGGGSDLFNLNLWGQSESDGFIEVPLWGDSSEIGLWGQSELEDFLDIPEWAGNLSQVDLFGSGTDGSGAPEPGEDFFAPPDWAEGDLFNLDLWGQPPPEWGEEPAQSDLFGMSLWESFLESPELPPSPITQWLVEEFTLPGIPEFPDLGGATKPSFPNFSSLKESVESSLSGPDNFGRFEEMLSRGFPGLKESSEVLWEHRFTAEGRFSGTITFSLNSSDSSH